LNHYKALNKEAGVDVTKYLVAQHTNYDKSIRLEGASEVATKLHFNLDGEVKK